MRNVPKIIPPRSRVRLVKADRRTPTWQKDVGRQFRVGYYSRKDGLDCIWLVNENGKYEQTTDRDFLLKYFVLEYLSDEKDYYGQRKRQLGKIRVRTPMMRLNGRSSLDAYEAAKEIGLMENLKSVRELINILRHGRRVLNRAAAAYVFYMRDDTRAIPALERAVNNRLEHPKVRGQAAEALAHCHREKSHRVLLNNLTDPSKELRFWCAYSLSEMGDEKALTPLRELASKDHRIVRGFWSVSREAKAAIREIQTAMRNRGQQKKCSFCSRSRKVKIRALSVE
jgi:HEAT repeats